MGDRRKWGFPSFGLEQATPESMIAFVDVTSFCYWFSFTQFICVSISLSIYLSLSLTISLSLYWCYFLFQFFIFTIYCVSISLSLPLYTKVSYLLGWWSRWSLCHCLWLVLTDGFTIFSVLVHVTLFRMYHPRLVSFCCFLKVREIPLAHVYLQLERSVQMRIFVF